MATYHEAHLRVDFFKKLVKGAQAERIYGAISLIITGLFTLILFYLAWDYVFNEKSGMITVRTQGDQIPDWIKVLSLPIAFGMMSLRFFARAIGKLLTAPEPEAEKEGQS